MIHDFTLPSIAILAGMVRACKPRRRKVGGLHFIRIGRLQVSWCVVRRRLPTPAPTPTPKPNHLDIEPLRVTYRGWTQIET